MVLFGKVNSQRGNNIPTPKLVIIKTVLYNVLCQVCCDECESWYYFKGARYSYRSVVLRNVLSLSARRPQIDLRG